MERNQFPEVEDGRYTCIINECDEEFEGTFYEGDPASNLFIHSKVELIKPQPLKELLSLVKSYPNRVGPALLAVSFDGIPRVRLFVKTTGHGSVKMRGVRYQQVGSCVEYKLSIFCSWVKDDFYPMYERIQTQ